MQELQRLTPEATEMHAVAPARKQKLLLGKLRPKPGQQVWQCCVHTGEIKLAEEEEAQAIMRKDGSAKVQRNIKVKEHHLYCLAINRSNAERKFVIQLEKILGKR